KAFSEKSKAFSEKSKAFSEKSKAFSEKSKAFSEKSKAFSEKTRHLQKNHPLTGSYRRAFGKLAGDFKKTRPAFCFEYRRKSAARLIPAPQPRRYCRNPPYCHA
ncbi:MAG: hypothetical protein NC344_06140, partial [Bacteroidales bacterium]|nr:hypothetical protein [Bacteroidales bacterium]MCM1147397.1 hypothetical protein [Bacteroidales bacterium]